MTIVTVSFLHTAEKGPVHTIIDRTLNEPYNTFRIILFV